MAEARGQVFRRLRKQRGVSLRQVDKETNIPSQTLSRIEAVEGYGVTFTDVATLCCYYGLPLTEAAAAYGVPYAPSMETDSTLLTAVIAAYKDAAPEIRRKMDAWLELILKHS